MHKASTGSSSDKRRPSQDHGGRIYVLPTPNRSRNAAAGSPLAVRTAGANGAVSTATRHAEEPDRLGTAAGRTQDG